MYSTFLVDLFIRTQVNEQPLAILKVPDNFPYQLAFFQPIYFIPEVQIQTFTVLVYFLKILNPLQFIHFVHLNTQKPISIGDIEQFLFPRLDETFDLMVSHYFAHYFILHHFISAVQISNKLFILRNCL